MSIRRAQADRPAMETAEKFRTAFEQAMVGMSHVALDGQLLQVNRRLCEITGYSRNELLATTFQQITHPDDLPGDVDAADKLVSGEIPAYSVEKRYIHKDGHVIWAKLSTSVVRDTNDKPLHYISVIDDVTEYKHAAQALATAEDKFCKAFRESPTVITITSAKDARYIEVNEAFESLSGYRREEVIGRTPYELGIWVDAAQRVEFVNRLLAGGRVRNEEHRFRMKDGSVRSALTSAELLELNGELCVLSAALDITDRKQMMETLQDLSARLICAQEEERKRISTELSDVVGQSAALLTIELAQLAKAVRGKSAQKLQQLSSKAQEIASDIGVISQGLHPSTLEYVGLTHAIEDVCREFGRHYGLQVAFEHHGIPRSISPAVALCLYRITQEALQNVVAHSGTSQAWIELAGNAQAISLTIRDNGAGFDLGSVKCGLGLLTMRERCRLLDGEFAVHSQKGTRLEVRIPLQDLAA